MPTPDRSDAPLPLADAILAVARASATLADAWIDALVSISNSVTNHRPADHDQVPIRHPEKPEPWVTKSELAAHLKVSVRTVSRRMAAGMPYTRKFNNSPPRFRISDVDAWMDAWMTDPGSN
jgi:hypothetical protein